MSTIIEDWCPIVGTIVCANYLPKAMLLAASMKKHHPACRIVVCLLEREIHPLAMKCPDFDMVILAKDLPYINFEAFIFRHMAVEAATAVKAKFLLHLLSQYPNSLDILYMDPDIFVFSGFAELQQALNQGAIIVTPHHVNDEESLAGVNDNMIRTLQCGIFNLGFLALRRSPEALSFLNWWDRKLENMCYIDWSRGLFVDQKWVDMAMSFFDLYVFREVGYNVANWNISKRIVTLDDGVYKVNGTPLRFFHFSGIDKGRDQSLFLKYAPDKDAPVHGLRKEYKRLIDKNGREVMWLIRWSYDCFNSGEPILNETRRLTRLKMELLERFSDPFNESNEVFLSFSS